ncbi:BFD domain protein (2Fe-2S)-binding domain protein [Actinobacteria bacterium OK074]|nr:BFD domain protein (2Fe-2S)-binding domain protein [Actinobacteria bacterium OK074]
MPTAEDPLVCLCARVRESVIVAALRAGSRDESAIRTATGAGSGCGDCLVEVADLILDAEHPVRPGGRTP